MTFKKFLHIENINNFKQCFVITEKIDGSNIQLIFDKGEMKVASRNQLCDNFNNCDEILKKEEYKKVIEYFIEQSKENTYNLYGEIFSNDIQKNIKYGNLSIRFFALAINNNYVSFKALRENINNDDLVVPIIGFYDSIDKALSIEVEGRKSLLCDDICEGVIIQPYTYFDERFILKKKCSKFSEIKSKSKQEKPTEEFKNLNKEFLNYLTYNRIKNIISHGYNKNSKLDIIAKEVIEDAKNDFLKDFNQETKDLAKKQLKEIFKINYFKLLEEIKIILNN